MSAAKRITPLMNRCLGDLRASGVLVRYDGGYWAKPDAPMCNRIPVGHYGATTVYGLINRELAEVTEKRAWDSMPLRVVPTQKSE